MKKWPNKRFWVALFIPVLILVAMTGKPLATYYFGQTIALQTIPFDPRDPFYGDYVDLHFQIEEIDQKELDKNLAKKVKSNPWIVYSVYVTLVQKGKFYEVKQVSTKKPKTTVFLEGTLTKSGDNKNHYRIQYNFERYYVEEGTGLELEKISRKGGLIVYLKARDGYAIITNVKKGDS